MLLGRFFFHMWTLLDERIHMSNGHFFKSWNWFSFKKFIEIHWIYLPQCIYTQWQPSTAAIVSFDTIIVYLLCTEMCWQPPAAAHVIPLGILKQQSESELVMLHSTITITRFGIYSKSMSRMLQIILSIVIHLKIYFSFRILMKHSSTHVAKLNSIEIHEMFIKYFHRMVTVFIWILCELIPAI